MMLNRNPRRPSGPGNLAPNYHRKFRRSTLRQASALQNTGDIVNAARELMANAGLRARYAKNARAYAERAFDIVGVGDRFLKAIDPDSILSSGPRLTVETSEFATASDDEIKHV